MNTDLRMHMIHKINKKMVLKGLKVHPLCYNVIKLKGYLVSITFPNEGCSHEGSEKLNISPLFGCHLLR